MAISSVETILTKGDAPSPTLENSEEKSLNKDTPVSDKLSEL